MDLVVIEALRIDTIIGIHDWEREVRQTLLLSLELGWDTRRAAASGDISDALDYSSLCAVVQKYVERSRFYLIEELAEGVAELLQREFGVPWLRLRIDKPGAVPQAQTVAVVVERGKR